MDPWQKAWIQSPSDARLFVRGVLSAVPDAWQDEALRAISTHDRVAIRAGHGVGKTTFLAWVILWFMFTRFPNRVPVVANGQDQLRDVVWPELRKWVDRLPPALKEQFEIEVERAYLKASPSEAFAVARVGNKANPEALQGFHNDNMLFAFEEASGIAEQVFEVGQGALSTPGSKMLMIGNPTRLSGMFFDAFHRLRSRWYTIRVNCEDVPRAQGHIDDIVARYGKDSNAYRVRVLGEFPSAEDETVIPLQWIEAAVSRDVKPNERLRVVWGLDVARFGDDRTALAKRRGNCMPEPVKWWQGKDTMQVAGLVKHEYERAHELDRPSAILVDVIGLGAGVVDRLRELHLPVRGVNVAESPSSQDRFMRLRDELWFKAREWFEARDCRIAKDDALIAELSAPSYSLTSAGKVVVESKQDMKRRGFRSPDLADAFILTMAGGLDAVQKNEPYRQRYKRQGNQSWMSA